MGYRGRQGLAPGWPRRRPGRARRRAEVRSRAARCGRGPGAGCGPSAARAAAASSLRRGHAAAVADEPPDPPGRRGRGRRRRHAPGAGLPGQRPARDSPREHRGRPRRQPVQHREGDERRPRDAVRHPQERDAGAAGSGAAGPGPGRRHRRGRGRCPRGAFPGCAGGQPAPGQPAGRGGLRLPGSATVRADGELGLRQLPAAPHGGGAAHGAVARGAAARRAVAAGGVRPSPADLHPSARSPGHRDGQGRGGAARQRPAPVAARRARGGTDRADGQAVNRRGGAPRGRAGRPGQPRRPEPHHAPGRPAPRACEALVGVPRGVPVGQGAQRSDRGARAGAGRGEPVGRGPHRARLPGRVAEGSAAAEGARRAEQRGAGPGAAVTGQCRLRGAQARAGDQPGAVRRTEREAEGDERLRRPQGAERRRGGFEPGPRRAPTGRRCR